MNPSDIAVNTGSMVLPVFTAMSEGFMSHGLAAAMVVIAATLVCLDRKMMGKVAIFGLVGFYLIITLFVNYFRERKEIRSSVWTRQSGLASRIETGLKMFSNFEWFSLSNPEHFDFVDGRLNQNWLVGAAVVRHEATGEWADGTTLRDSAFAFIPRFLWPNKPAAGSGDLVSQYTGLVFSDGTSVGIGAVMELYVNHGPPVVFVGFFLIGVSLVWLERATVSALKIGDWTRAASFYLVGLSLENVGGSLVEVVMGASAALVLASVLAILLDMVGMRRRPATARPSNRTVRTLAHSSYS